MGGPLRLAVPPVEAAVILRLADMDGQPVTLRWNQGNGTEKIYRGTFVLSSQFAFFIDGPDRPVFVTHPTRDLTLEFDLARGQLFPVLLDEPEGAA